MAYDASLPDGAKKISVSDDDIRANFAQIVANITNQHVWDNSDATKVVHYRECGIIARDTTVLGTPDPLGIVDENLTMAVTPTLVIFDYQYLNGSAVEITCGHGYHDGTDDKTFAFFTQTGATTAWAAVNSATTCIYLRDDSGPDAQSATCSFAAGKFTLTWTKAGSPTGTAQIRYTVFG